MTTYSTIFTLGIEHSYYPNDVCQSVVIQPQSAAAGLLRKRGLMFRQTATNQWSLVGECSNLHNISEVIGLQMSITEPRFSHITTWPDFNPLTMHTLSLPLAQSRQQAIDTILPSKDRATRGVICLITLTLSEPLITAAQQGTPIYNTLIFRAPKLYHQYLFVPRSDNTNRLLRIEDTSGRHVFGQAEQVKFAPLSTLIWCITSINPIPIHENQNFNLRLIETLSGQPPTERTLISHLPPVHPGDFVCEHPNTVRQVVYY